MKKQRLYFRIVIALIIATLLVYIFPGGKLSAASAKIGLNKNSVSTGENITVTVSLSAPVADFRSYGLLLGYDADKFQYVSCADRTGKASANGVVREQGTVSIATLPFDQLYEGTNVVSVTFKAKAATQSAPFSITRLTIGSTAAFSGPSVTAKVESAGSQPTSTPRTTAAATTKANPSPTPRPTAVPTPTTKDTVLSTTAANQTTAVVTTMIVEETVDNEEIVATSPLADNEEAYISFNSEVLLKADQAPTDEDIPKGFLLVEDEDVNKPITYVLSGSGFRILWLKNTKDQNAFYYYDIDEDVYLPYQLISYPLGLFRISLPSKNDRLPQGFIKTEIKLGEMGYPAFRPDPDLELPAGIIRLPQQLYLLYLVKDPQLEGDNATEEDLQGGFYYFDQESKSIFPYIYLPLEIPATAAISPTEEEVVPTELIEKTEPELEPEATLWGDWEDDEIEDLNYEIAALQKKRDDYRTFALIVVAILLSSWLVFWFLSLKKRAAQQAKKGKGKIAKEEKRFIPTAPKKDILPAAAEEFKPNLNYPAQGRTEEFEKEFDEPFIEANAFSKRDDFKDFGPFISFAGNNGSTNRSDHTPEKDIPWYLEEEQERKTEFARPRDTKADDVLIEEGHIRQNSKAVSIDGHNGSFRANGPANGANQGGVPWYLAEDDPGFMRKNGFTGQTMPRANNVKVERPAPARKDEAKSKSEPKKAKKSARFLAAKEDSRYKPQKDRPAKASEQLKRKEKEIKRSLRQQVEQKREQENNIYRADNKNLQEDTRKIEDIFGDLGEV